jgi:hypothetical protein
VVVEGATVVTVVVTTVVKSELRDSQAKSPTSQAFVSVCITIGHVADELFDLDLLEEEDPFEIDAQAAHLFKHPRLGIEDIREVWASDPMFYPAKPPAHWLMVAEVDGTVLMVPLAPARDGNPTRCRPIGCYQASIHLADQYRRDR